MIQFLISTTFIFLIDKFICSNITKARWFSLHAIFNFFGDGIFLVDEPSCKNLY